MERPEPFRWSDAIPHGIAGTVWLSGWWWSMVGFGADPLTAAFLGLLGVLLFGLPLVFVAGLGWGFVHEVRSFGKRRKTACETDSLARLGGSEAPLAAVPPGAPATRSWG